MRMTLFLNDGIPFHELAKRFHENSRGVALVLVLWILAFLSVLVGEFCLAMRTEINITNNLKEETLSYYYARAGVNLAIHRLIYDGGFPSSIEGDETIWEDEPIEWQLGSTIPNISFGEGHIGIEIENESGKININDANDVLLGVMLNPIDLDDQDEAIIIDSILDWRDRDDLYRLNGAENDYYRSLENPYDAKNGPFDSIEELLLVRGVTPEIFYGGISEMVTVHAGEGSDSDRININAAPPEVLLALPQMTDESVLAVMEYRVEQPFQSVAQVSSVVGREIYLEIARFLTTRLAPQYRIRSVGTISESPARRGIEVLLVLDNTLKQRHHIIEWLDNVDFQL